jgi:bifunctional non-homologous end joining protein LigD
MSDLKKYNEKRDFSKTSEPLGKKRKSSGKLKFVVQHHFSRREHYDLRLEYEGVFVSFAVPKGLSYNRKDKRLAVHVEDHPISYGNFEGNIPKGEYGAGVVMLWDKGFWKPKGKVDFVKGPVKFTLSGERLKGDWTLIKFKEDNWLLIKEKDELNINESILKYKTSVKTGRTKTQIENNEVILEDKVISNPKKIIFGKGKVTKEDIVNYYKLVSKRMMPFLNKRLISTVRAPKGLVGEKFFMKHLNTDSKDIGKRSVKDKYGEKSDYFYIKNVNGIIDEVQMNSYEFHIWGSKTPKISKPDVIVFDLDPDEGLSVKKVREGVRDLKSIIDKLKLKSYLKTSGGKGYHVFVKLDLPSFKKAEEVSRSVALLMVSKWPNKYTINMRKEKRKGKIFIDYFRNKKGATSVCPYSLRLRDNATISFPISWKDLDKVKPDQVTIKNVKNFLKKRDPWKGFVLD